MSSVDFVVKLREACAIVMDACEDYLEKSGMTKIPDKEIQWDPNMVVWVKKDGDRGPYELAEPDPNNKVYQAMLQDLKAHDGKLTKDGYFYWVFTDGKAIGRKKKT